jgi:dUTP pyrophosphatase
MAYDFTSLETYDLLPGEAHHFITDIKVFLEDTQCLILNVRSSIGVKKGLRLINTQGWIDSDFYSNPDNDGNIGIYLYNPTNALVTINSGDRIAQGAIFRFDTVQNDNAKGERLGGFGSTGA